MLRISPSILAMYFYYECPRYFLYRSSVEIQKNLKKLSDVNYNESPLTRAILQGGYIWEEEVVEKKLKKNVRTAIKQKGDKTRDLIFTYKETLRELSTLKKGEFLYQGTFETPDSFYKEFGIDPKKVQMSPCRPDLIECSQDNGRKGLSIVDIKSSSHLKTSHKIQVSHYLLLLKHIMEKEGIDTPVNLKTGKIWLSQAEEPITFDVETILPHIYDFFNVKLPAYQKMEHDEVPWHIKPKCEGCEFVLFCDNEAKKKQTISLVPGLSNNAKYYLNQLSVYSINDFSKLLKKKDINKILSKSASLSGRERQLKAQIASLKSSSVIPFGNSSIRMPVWENVRIILTVEREPLTGIVYALGYSRYGGSKVFDDNFDQEYYIAGSMDETVSVAENFIVGLFQVMVQVHNYNIENEEFLERQSIQVYVYENSEIDAINEVLVSQLKNPKVAEKALDLLFYFQSESLTHADDHPKEETSFPLISIASITRELLSLPIPIGCNLRTLHESVKSSKCNFTYGGYEFYNYDYSGVLRGDAIYYVWHEAKSEYIGKIEAELKLRSRAKNDIIIGIREKALRESGEQILFAWPAKFLFPESTGYSKPTLSKLAFIVRYETVLDFLETKSQRALSRDERLGNGYAFHLTAQHDCSDEFLVQEYGFSAEMEKGFSWLLTEDDDECDRSQMAFNDYWYKDKHYGNKNFNGYLTSVDGISEDDKGRVTVYLTNTYKHGFEKGQKFLLHRRFTDYISARITTHLKKLDETRIDTVCDIIDNTEKFFKKLKDGDKKLISLSKQIPKLKLTSSQSNALTHYFKNNLSLVWGPPGTGKTHFIAVAVLSMLEAHRLSGEECSIFITAYTHAAIENCLNKVMEVNAKYKILHEELDLYKLKGVKFEKYSGLPILDPKDFHYTVSASKRSIVGGTIFEIAKLSNKSDVQFDTIVIDEASQMKVPEASIPLGLGDKETRYLIVGDDKQLPPITKGCYPEPKENELPLHRSVFEILRAKDKKGLILCQLYENFRMNTVLCKYPAQAIYGENYLSFGKRIGQSKIQLKTPINDKSIYDYILNPEFPLVVCVLDGVFSAVENVEEAKIIAELATRLRSNIMSPITGTVYPKGAKGDEEFWREGLFIVSPHHLQIAAIKSELKNKKLQSPYFVDTVDKMQGQECDAVIVGYGLSDSEKATQESEFIYSLNRLNVSITRARSKCIVFLSRPLLTPPLDALDNDSSAEGISFMLGLENFVKNGQSKKYDISKTDGISCTVYRKGFLDVK